MSYWKKLAYFISTVIGLSNIIAVYLFWKYEKKAESLSVPQFNFSEYLAAQSLQNTTLQFYLIIFSIFLALLAFYGYSQIKKGAEQKAAEVAKEYVEEFLENKAEKINLGRPSFPYSEEEPPKNGNSNS